MIKYKKLKIKNTEKTEELDINDMESLNILSDVQFENRIHFINNTMVRSYFDSDLEHRVIKLNKNADWVIREYEGELYLIPLKKDC